MLEQKSAPGVTPASASQGTPQASSKVVHVSPDPDGFRRFGTIVKHHGTDSTRADFSHVFETSEENVPRLHVNRVDATDLPMKVSTLERHPSSWQTFLPLDVLRYVVFVCGSNPSGEPDPADAHAWVFEGNIGISFAPGIWHAGAAVLDNLGHFAVIWPRAECASDTEVLTMNESFVIVR